MDVSYIKERITTMKFHRWGAAMLSVFLCLGLLSGCGTSQEDSASLLSIPEDESWAELTPPTTSQRPETETVLPELTLPDTEKDGDDVTSDYKGSVLGTWDNDKNTLTYEFKSNENLIITTSSGNATSYTYWFLDNDGQIRLCIYENGQEEATSYGFTLNGSNLTLYDLTGNAVELLTRRATVTPTPAAAATARPTTVPSAVPSAVPSPSPTVVPSPTPSVEPSPSPSPVEPSPSPSPEIQLPGYVSGSLSGVECVLDVMLDGKPFDAANSDAFWNILARYMSLFKSSNEDGYFTASQEEVEAYAGKIFPSFSEIPSCPEGTTLVEQRSEEDVISYRVLWGATSGHEVEVLAYAEDVLTVQLDDTHTFYVTINGDGTIAAVDAAE